MTAREKWIAGGLVLLFLWASAQRKAAAAQAVSNATVVTGDVAQGSDWYSWLGAGFGGNQGTPLGGVQ